MNKVVYQKSWTGQGTSLYQNVANDVLILFVVGTASVYRAWYYDVCTKSFCRDTGLHFRDKGLISAYVMRCTIWYHLEYLKNVKNSLGEVLVLVRLPALACIFTKSNTIRWQFSPFFKLCKWHQIAQKLHFSRLSTENVELLSLSNSM